MYSRPAHSSLEIASLTLTDHHAGSLSVHSGPDATVVGSNDTSQPTMGRPIRSTAYRGTMLNDVDTRAKKCIVLLASFYILQCNIIDLIN